MSSPPPGAPLDSHDARVRVARMFLRGGQPLAAALLFAELVRARSRAPEVWCGLAAALLGARGGPRTRRGLEIWAALVLRDAAEVAIGTPFAATVAKLVAGLTAPADDDMFEAAEMDALQRYLLEPGPLLAPALDRLPPADHQYAVTLLAEHSVHAAPVVAAAITGRWGAAVARAALRRIDRFTANADVRAAVAAATRSPERDALEPYLGRALDALGR
jgi:hypothetical protein